MATRAQLDIQAAGQAAYAEAYPVALDEINGTIQQQLEMAQASLTAGIMLVADACGLDPIVREPMQTLINGKSKELVKAIFEAAVREVGKGDEAKELAEIAASAARAKKDNEILEGRVEAMMSSRRVVPAGRSRIVRGTPRRG